MTTCSEYTWTPGPPPGVGKYHLMFDAFSVVSTILRIEDGCAYLDGGGTWAMANIVKHAQVASPVLMKSLLDGVEELTETKTRWAMRYQESEDRREVLVNERDELQMQVTRQGANYTALERQRDKLQEGLRKCQADPLSRAWAKPFLPEIAALLLRLEASEKESKELRAIVHSCRHPTGGDTL